MEEETENIVDKGEEEKKDKSIIDKVPRPMLWGTLILAIVMVVNYKNSELMKTLVMVIFVLVIAMYFMGNKKEEEIIAITTELEAKAFLVDLLQKKKKTKEIPYNTEIRILLASAEPVIDGVVPKFFIPFKLVHQDKSSEEWLAKIDRRTTSTTFETFDEGFTGKEKPHMTKILPKGFNELKKHGLLNKLGLK